MNSSDSHLNKDVSNKDVPSAPVVLLLLDGWGIAPLSEANAITSADTPAFNDLVANYPVALLSAENKSLNARYLSLGAGSDLINENINPSATLNMILANAGLKQLKITETERLAALTYFFNGHSDNKAKEEEWKIISSEVGDNRIKSPLVSNKITAEFIKNLKADKYNFFTIALPTLDLAAQSGDIGTVKKAIRVIDNNVKKIAEAVLDKKGILIISAAGGNVENIKNMATELIDKDMTDNPVPLIIVGERFKGKTFGLKEPINNDLSLLAPAGNLGDLAPTILEIMNLPKSGMTGKTLIVKE